MSADASMRSISAFFPSRRAASRLSAAQEYLNSSVSMSSASYAKNTAPRVARDFVRWSYAITTIHVGATRSRRVVSHTPCSLYPHHAAISILWRNNSPTTVQALILFFQDRLKRILHVDLSSTPLSVFTPRYRGGGIYLARGK